jgi:hypothetical protein
VRRASSVSHGEERMIRPTVFVAGSMVFGFLLPTPVHSFAGMVPTTTKNTPSSSSSSRYISPASFRQCNIRPFPLFSTRASSVSITNMDEKLDACLKTLNHAAETKAEDTNAVYQALIDLEQVSRLVGQLERQGNGSGSGSSSSSGTGSAVAATTTLSSSTMALQLNGSWCLVLSAGTAQTPEKLPGRVRYHPLKVIQSFDTDSKAIAVGLFLGNFCITKLTGSFDFDATKRCLVFDFEAARILNAFTVALAPRGGAARLRSARELGSVDNVANFTEQQRLQLPFFHWISADATLATARGGGGGLALWKRVKGVSK